MSASNQHFTPEIISKHLNTLESFGIESTGEIISPANGWCYVKGRLTNHIFDNLTDELRAVTISFMSMRPDDMKVQVTNGLDVFTRRLVFPIKDINDEIDFAKVRRITCEPFDQTKPWDTRI